MEVKKIVEGMTAQQVAQVIDDNFKAQNKILEEDIAKQNNVIGVSEYKDFSEAEAVNVGDVRKYNGFLYECVEATTGAFDASKWKKSSFKAETEKKLSELGLGIGSYSYVQLNYEGVIKGSNVESSFVYFYSDFIPVNEGDIVRFKSAGGTTAYLCAGYETNDFSSFVENSTANKMGYSDANGENPIHDIEVVIDANTKYIVIGCDGRVITNKTVVVEKISRGIISRISELENLIKGEITNTSVSAYSILKSPSTQPRKGFIAWCMDCGDNFFFNESKEYDKKLVEVGYKNTTYAVLPSDLAVLSKKELVKYFFDLGREMVIHSDERIYEANNSETEYEELVQTYFKEMNESGITPSGGWISLGGYTVPYMNMLKKYIGWGQTGPKNYDIVNDNEYMLGVNTLDTEPTHFMRLFIEQTPEQVTEEITNKIINRAKEVIDLAANNGSYIIFYTHSYNRPNAVYTLYPKVFDAILEYIKEKHSKGLINIGAVGDMIEYYYSKRYNEYPSK